MKDIESELYAQIKVHFSCDKRGVKFMSRLIVSLLKITQSSLSKWSKAIKGEQTLDAKYKQLQRFARFFCFSPRIYAQLIWQVFGKEQQVYLTLDRTEWKQRGEWIQVLMLGIAHQGMSIPLLWQTSNIKGNSALSTKKALIKCFTNWIKPAHGQEIYCLADREFGSKYWFDLLFQYKIHFCIRLKKNALLRSKQQSKQQSKGVALYTLFDNRLGFKTRARLTLKEPVYVYGTCLYVSGHQLGNGEYLW